MPSIFDSTTLLTFGLASLTLVLAPGPGQALVLARTLQSGARAGILTALGLEIGTVVHTMAAALGLSAILMTSATAFTVVKVLGSAYLVLLGVQTLRTSQSAAVSTAPVTQRMSATNLLLHAAITGLLNPKVALFFMAFLPLFVSPGRGHVLAQFLLLGLGFSAVGLLGDCLLALIAGRARARFMEAGAFARWRESITGLVLIGLGVRLVAVSRT